MKPWPLHPPTGILATQSPGASGWSPQSHGFLAYHVETKTELVSRHHSAHSDTLVPPSHPSLHTGHSSAHVKQAFVRIRFKKYQCIVQELSPNIMHHTTHHSFALFFVFCFNFFFNKSSCLRFFIRDFVPSIFLFVHFNNQSVRLYPGAHGGTGYGAKWHALAGTHSPHFFAGPGQPGSWSGHNISPA